MLSFTLTLTPDRPTDTRAIVTMIQTWNPTSRQLADPSTGVHQFSVQLSRDEQERFTDLFTLHERLQLQAISFSLEHKP